MNRREFISLLGGAAVGALTWPLGARAQERAVTLIGFLHTRSRDAFTNLAGFLKALGEAGYVDGQSIFIDYRFVDGQYDRLPAMAADLVARKVAVLVTGGGEPSPLAAKAATSTIPIVFAMGSDPVKAGLVASYNRPGGNITGINILTDTLEAKRLGLLHELVPNAATIGYLWNPRFPTAAENQRKDVLEAARALAMTIRLLPASTDREIEAAFETITRERIPALNVGADPFLDTRRDAIIAFSARQAVPTMYPLQEHAKASGLMSYGIDITDAYRQVGVYVGRILKGEKPANLPVLQPTKFEFVINLKTAKALGLTIPPMLLARADEVIE
jgi:putative ABC transport system substrate-binding protein